MDLISLEELLQSTKINKAFLDNLLSLHLVSKPLSENEHEVLFSATEVEQINHILSLQSLGYSLQDISKILKITNLKINKTPAKNRYFTVGEVANQLKLTKRTLDFWIEKGLIKPSSTSASGYRLFSEDAVRFVSFVSDLQILGFTLEQIKVITESFDENFKPIGTNTAQSIADIQAKIKDNEKAIRKLKSVLKIMQKNNRSPKGKEDKNSENKDDLLR